jgi:ATP-dependent DNA helicase RecG
MSENEHLPLLALIERLEKEKPTLVLNEDEIFDLADADLLRKIQEDKRIERKPAGIHAKALADYFVMWSNTPSNGGLVAVGIEDDGTLSGCSSKGIQHINKLESASMDFCPDVRFSLKQINFTHSDGQQDFVLLFRVRYIENKLVRNSKGEAFDRRGDKKHTLNETECRELEIDKGQISFESEPSFLAYPYDFDLQLIDEFAGNYRRIKQKQYEDSNEEILEHNHLGKIRDGKFIPNNACVIAFAKSPRAVISGCRIRFLRYEGEEEGTGDRWNAQKDTWIETGSLPHQIREAREIIESQLRTFTRLDKKDGKFHTAPEYPPFAWYEALVNACVHRSYSLMNMNIFIKMFDDRLEIESPGGFPSVVNSENIYTTHYPRNPHLFEAMFYLGFVKGVREGTRRMRESMLRMELPPPEFIQMSGNYHSIVVKLRNEVKQRKVWLDSDTLEVVGETLFKTLSQDEKRLINFIAEHDEISVSNAVRLTQLNWHSARNLLNKLAERGILKSTHRKDVVKQKGRDTAARYRLNR